MCIPSLNPLTLTPKVIALISIADRHPGLLLKDAVLTVSGTLHVPVTCHRICLLNQSVGSQRAAAMSLFGMLCPSLYWLAAWNIRDTSQILVGNILDVPLSLESLV